MLWDLRMAPSKYVFLVRIEDPEDAFGFEDGSMRIQNQSDKGSQVFYHTVFVII